MLSFFIHAAICDVLIVFWQLQNDDSETPHPLHRIRLLAFFSVARPNDFWHHSCMEMFPWYLQLILGVEFLLGIAGLLAFIAVSYWFIQLMKAAIRALDRWNPVPTSRTKEPGPSLREVSPALAEMQKYGPKP